MPGPEDEDEDEDEEEEEEDERGGGVSEHFRAKGCEESFFSEGEWNPYFRDWD